jgi:cytochrome P450
MITDTADRAVPDLDTDPFSEAFLTDPYRDHARMRDAGPVVRLTRYGIYAMARYKEVFAALNDWRAFSSARGVGLQDFAKEAPWRPKSIVLETDPPLHDRTRRVLQRVMSPAAMRRLREEFQAKAVRLVENLVAKRDIEAVGELAEAYPLEVFPDAVGLVRQGRENLLPYSSMVFNSFGPRNAIFEASTGAAEPVLAWIHAQCARGACAERGFAADIWAAHDVGEITAEEAAILVRSLLTAGLDTTVNGFANAVLAFAMHPEQWRRVRADRSLVKPAFDEVLRWESPVQTFFRTTTRTVEFAHVALPEGAKVLLLLGAANRDPRKWPEPERFDVTRRPVGHVALGAGVHVCVGQLIARLEAEVLLEALADRVTRSS